MDSAAVRKKIRESGLKAYKKDSKRLPLRELKLKNPKLFKVISASDAVKAADNTRSNAISLALDDLKYLGEGPRTNEIFWQRIKEERKQGYREIAQQPKYKGVFKSYFKKRRSGMDMYEAALESMKEERIQVVRFSEGKKFVEISTGLLTPEKLKKLVEMKKLPTKAELEKIIEK